VATRESSLTIAACFHRILLSPTAFHGTLTILSLSLSLVLFSFSLALTASVALLRRSPLHLLRSYLFPRPGTSYISLPPSCLFPLSLFLPISTPFLSSRASTRLPNTAISALSPLRHFNYEMINSWPVCPALSRRSFPQPRRTALSSFRRQPLRVSSAVKLVRSIDSID